LLIVTPSACLESFANIGTQQNTDAYPFGEEVNDIKSCAAGERKGLKDVEGADIKNAKTVNWDWYLTSKCLVIYDVFNEGGTHTRIKVKAANSRQRVRSISLTPRAAKRQTKIVTIWKESTTLALTFLQ
jgi:hypothetical protein